MQVGIAPQELLFLSVGGATNGGHCCDSDSHHAGIAEQCLDPRQLLSPLTHF